MKDTIIVDEDKHSYFAKATKVKHAMNIRTMERLVPAAKTLLLYAVFYHRDYQTPIPPGRRFKKLFGWSESTFYRAIGELIEKNAFKAVGTGPARKVYVNPMLVCNGSDNDQYRFWRIIQNWQALGADDSIEDDIEYDDEVEEVLPVADGQKKTRRPNIADLVARKEAIPGGR